jgi:short-subunit dehydrogenase
VTLACPGFVQTSIASNMIATSGTETVEKILEKGLSPSECAEAIADAIERENAEFYVGGWETMNVYLKRFLPGLLRRLLRLQA